jgi:hypothetical protein
MSKKTLVFHLRGARRKAIRSAAGEALALLAGLGPEEMAGGPLSELGGIFWLSLPGEKLEEAEPRFPRLGYSTAVDLVESFIAGHGGDREKVRWRGSNYRLRRLYTEDEAEAREAAPDRRPFALAIGGQVRPVKGYRGDGGPLSRRGLPVCDARLLVNLTQATPGARLLDPFAGIGGVLIEAAAAGVAAVSVDNDAFLRYGLARISGGRHCLADASRLPFRDGTFDAIATEPPYDRSAEPVVPAFVDEAYRVLRQGAFLAVLCSLWQEAPLKAAAADKGFVLRHEERIDRKGSACPALLWRKP